MHVIKTVESCEKGEREGGMGNAAPSQNLSVAQPARLDEGSLIQAISYV
jgi:hypothetical protein